MRFPCQSFRLTQIQNGWWLMRLQIPPAYYEGKKMKCLLRTVQEATYKELYQLTFREF